MAKKVLITGMSGLIGGLLKDRLAEAGGYELTALNRREVEGVRTVRADISDMEAIRPAFEGQDVVVHLAAYLGSQDWEGQHAGNVLGTYNVFEAARQAGVGRVIFASSGNAIRGFERVPPYSDIAAGNYDAVPADFPKITHEQVRPEALYGAAKVWGEALARHFSDDYGMSMICVTHEMNFARRVAHRVIFMDEGRIVEDQSPKDFFENPQTDRARLFLSQILDH